MPMLVLRTSKMQRQRRSSVAGSLGSGEWQKSEPFPCEGRQGDLDGANRGSALSPTGKLLRVGVIAVVDDQGRRKALRRAFVLLENSFTFTPYGNRFDRLLFDVR